MEDNGGTDAAELLASLRLSEARLRGVLESISDGFYAIDRNWILTEFNPAAERYFRLKRDQVVGRNYWTLVAGASDEFRAMLRAAMDGAPMAVLEAPSLYRPDRFVELRVAPTEEGVCVALTDVTDRRAVRDRLEKAVAERTAALQASENRVRTILETTHLFQGLLQPDGTVIDCNAASLAAIGAEKRDIVGHKYWETPWFTGTSGMSERIRESIEAAARGDTVAYSGLTLTLPDGMRSFDFTIRPVFDETGAVSAIVPEANETTARLKAEEDLRQAQKLEAVGQLTGGVAHDFNNLLMVISGGLNMLERSDDPDRRDMLMARMREAVQRGATLTKQLLAFSRRHQLSPESVHLQRYFSGLSDLLSRSLGPNVKVAIDVPADVHPVLADPNALQLAILNLAVNARDAMSDSGVVRIVVRDGAANMIEAPAVSISVIDSGAGMTPEVRARIFEPFFTTKEIGKGSGLGLAQVHGFAQQSGGHIEVQSTPGQGTCMTLVLPRAEQTENAPAVAPVKTATLATRAAPKGEALLVEDDDQVAPLAMDMLSHLGWRVTRAASAEEAIGFVAGGFEPKLVLSDVMMPGGRNGIELARVLRERNANLPIVLASGYAESVQRDADAAGLKLLSKPFDIDALSAAIADACVTRS